MEGTREVPRLGISVSSDVVKAAILSSFQTLGYDRPSEEQEEEITEFVYGRDLFLSGCQLGAESPCALSVCPLCLSF